MDIISNENTKINVKEIFENAMNDPALFSTLDIETLLDSIENTKNDYLYGKTTETVSKEIYDVIRGLDCSLVAVQTFCNKLIGYRFVGEIFELHKGKHIRWIRKNNGCNPNITNGGIVVNIKFTDNGINIVCMTTNQRYFQFKYDDCLIFQKMTAEEQLILMAYENLEKD